MFAFAAMGTAQARAARWPIARGLARLYERDEIAKMPRMDGVLCLPDRIRSNPLLKDNGDQERLPFALK
jgi:hypothetical protein